MRMVWNRYIIDITGQLVLSIVARDCIQVWFFSHLVMAQSQLNSPKGKATPSRTTGTRITICDKYTRLPLPESAYLSEIVIIVPVFPVRNGNMCRKTVVARRAQVVVLKTVLRTPIHALILATV